MAARSNAATFRAKRGAGCELNQQKNTLCDWRDIFLLFAGQPVTYFILDSNATLPAKLINLLIREQSFVLFIVLRPHLEGMIVSSLTSRINTFEILSLIWLNISKSRCLLSLFSFLGGDLADWSIFL